MSSMLQPMEGSRVRVILGETGADYLLLLNYCSSTTTSTATATNDHQNTTSSSSSNHYQEWQEQHWGGPGVPADLIQQMYEYLQEAPNRYIKAVDFCRHDGGNDDDDDCNIRATTTTTMESHNNNNNNANSSSSNDDTAWYLQGLQRDRRGPSYWTGQYASADLALHRQRSDDFGVSFGTDEYGNLSHVLWFAVWYEGHNLPVQLVDRLDRTCHRGIPIHAVRLFHNGFFFVRDAEGIHWGLCRDQHAALWDALSGTIKATPNHHHHHHPKPPQQHYDDCVQDVALAEDGAWVVIREHSFATSHNVDDEVKEYLHDYYFGQQQQEEEERMISPQQPSETDHLRLHHQQLQPTDVVHRHAERFRRHEHDEAFRRHHQQQQQLSHHHPPEQQHFEKQKQQQQQALDLVALVRDLRDTEAYIRALEQQRRQDQERLQATQDQLASAKTSFQQVYATLPRAEQFATDVLDNNNKQKTTHPLNATANTNATATKNVCVVCQDQDARHATIPCGHLCLCDECAKQVAQTQPCPLCRTAVQSTLRIYR